jgi:hypothetical protein
LPGTGMWPGLWACTKTDPLPNRWFELIPAMGPRIMDNK